MPKQGDVVIYTRGGRSVNALVLSSRDGEVSHLGANREPLLTLAFVKFPNPNPIVNKRPNPVQEATTVPEIEIEHDVVHASHEFSPEFKREKGLATPAQIASLRGHGAWATAEVNPDGGSKKPVDDSAIGEQAIAGNTPAIAASVPPAAATGPQAVRDETPAEEKTREAREDRASEQKSEDRAESKAIAGKASHRKSA